MMSNRNDSAGYNNGLKKGITKLEYAAIAAMQGMLAADTDRDLSTGNIKEWAVKCANALFDELEQEKVNDME